MLNDWCILHRISLTEVVDGVEVVVRVRATAAQSVDGPVYILNYPNSFEPSKVRSRCTWAQRDRDSRLSIEKIIRFKQDTWRPPCNQLGSHTAPWTSFSGYLSGIRYTAEEDVSSREWAIERRSGDVVDTAWNSENFLLNCLLMTMVDCILRTKKIY